MLNFRNANILQPDAGTQQFGTGNSMPISMRCPHCRNMGSFGSVTGHVQYSKTIAADRPTVQLCIATVRVCPNESCRGLVLTVTGGRDLLQAIPPQSIEFSPEGLPQECADTLAEAAACHAAGAYRASAMMVRRLLEEVCALNNARGANLHQRIEALKSLITLPQPLFEAMQELKALGNDAAHIEAKAYDNIGEEESEVSIKLAGEILKSLYQLKGIVAKLQSMRN
jgi:hypothetical protein